MGDGGGRLRLPILRFRDVQGVAGNFDALLQAVEHGIAVRFPPFSARKLFRRLSGLPIAGFLKGRGVDRRTLVIGTDCAAGEDEQGQSGT